MRNKCTGDFENVEKLGEGRQRLPESEMPEVGFKDVHVICRSTGAKKTWKRETVGWLWGQET